MSRLPRIIVTGVAHHVTQRGNRRQRVFLVDDDYALYKDWLAQSCKSNGVAVWSYCFMPNHIPCEVLGYGAGPRIGSCLDERPKHRVTIDEQSGAFSTRAASWPGDTSRQTRLTCIYATVGFAGENRVNGKVSP